MIALGSGGCKKRSIEASPVEALPDGSIHATFRLLADRKGIESNGHGGGCIFTDLGIARKCSTNSDCEIPKLMGMGGYSELSVVAGGFGECLDSGNGQRRCAWKGAPDNHWCFKRPPSPPAPPPPGPGLDLNQANVLPVNAALVSPSKLHPGRWANYVLVTCLNARDTVSGATIPGCNQPGDQGEKFGQGPWVAIPSWEGP